MNYYSCNFWHPMAHPNEIKSRDPVHIMSGDGVYITDDKGRKLLDCNSGGLSCVTIGHNRSEIKDAIKQQLDELVFYQLFDGISHPRATELAKKLIEMTAPENMARAFFTCGGSDSVEAALRLARQYHVLNGEPMRKKFISLKKGYHGTHFGASSINGMDAGICRAPYEPLLGGCINVDAPWLYSNPWHCNDPEQLANHCIDQLVSEIEFHSAGTIAAMIAEPVLGGSVIVPPENYWPRLREVCNHYGILLIADEVMTGFGRSGSMFGSRGWGVAPDMMTFAKGISSGYFPLGAVMLNKRIEQAWDTNHDANGLISTGVTYSGHPVGCAAGLASLAITEAENLPENARVQGNYLLEKLGGFIDQFESVSDVRGKGLMLVLELSDRGSPELNQNFGRKLATVARDNGIMIRPYGGRIMLSPPLIFTTAHCDQLLAALANSFDELGG